jgi:hypothetical protein
VMEGAVQHRVGRAHTGRRRSGAADVRTVVRLRSRTQLRHLNARHRVQARDRSWAPPGGHEPQAVPGLHRAAVPPWRRAASVAPVRICQASQEGVTVATRSQLQIHAPLHEQTNDRLSGLSPRPPRQRRRGPVRAVGEPTRSTRSPLTRGELQ